MEAILLNIRMPVMLKLLDVVKKISQLASKPEEYWFWITFFPVCRKII